jgi:hypothetical protein
MKPGVLSDHTNGSQEGIPEDKMLPEKNPTITPVTATVITHTNVDRDSGALLNKSGVNTANTTIPQIKGGTEPVPAKRTL